MGKTLTRLPRRSARLAATLGLTFSLISAHGVLAKGDVIRFGFNDTGSAVVTDLCAFPVNVAWDIDNATVFRIEGDTPDTQVWGHHSVRGTDTWSNDATGRSVSVRWVNTLARTDLDFSALTIDSDGLWQGTVTAVDHYSGTYVGTVPGYGRVVLGAGHAVFTHTGVFVDDERVSRTDDMVFEAGPSDDLSRLCAYLGGG